MSWHSRSSRSLDRALCLLIVFSCTQLSAQVENGAIAGEITVSRSSFPAERIKLTLQTRGIVVSEVWTDTEGKFLFRDLPANLYHVTIDDDKYEPYKEEVDVQPRINPLNILSIALTPKVVKGQNNSAIHGSNPYIADAASYERNFPKKAVREFKRGTESQLKGDYENAIQHFQRALNLAPDFYPAHNDLGAVYVRQRKFSEAQAEFETALSENQSDAEAYFNLGNVFLLTNRQEEATNKIQEGLRRQPSSAYGQFLLGSIYEQQSRMPEAERALQKAVNLDPALAAAHLQLVNLYLRQQRDVDAIGELTFFLKNFPSDPLVRHATEVLQRLTKERALSKTD